jgi:tetratricopeptide (TPR) repeat protein
VKRKEKIAGFCLFLCLVVSCALGYAASKDGSAKDAFLQANKSKIAKAYTHYTMGILYDNMDNLKAAADEYKKALEYDPYSSAINLRLSFDYIKLGQYESAMKQLKCAIKASSEDTGPHFLLAFLYTARSKFDDAASEYKKILAKDPEEPSALSSLADIYVLQGKSKEALLIYAKLAQYKDIAPLALFNMGILYSSLDNFNAAEYCLKRAIFECEKEVRFGELIEEAHILHFYISTLYEKNGDYTKAEGHLKRAIYLYPDDHEALNYLGYMYAERNEHLDEAIALIKKALEFEPDNGAYLDSLGWAYFKKGMLKEALFNLEKAQEAMPDHEIEGHLKEVKEKLKR